MITNTESIAFEGRTIITYIRGTIKLSYFELATAPEDINTRAALNPIECDYSARIEWANRRVIVTIGDYIIASWILGDKTAMTFNNDKGYGDKHVHSYVKALPVDIISDVLGYLWPKM